MLNRPCSNWPNLLWPVGRLGWAWQRPQFPAGLTSGLATLHPRGGKLANREDVVFPKTPSVIYPKERVKGRSNPLPHTIRRKLSRLRHHVRQGWPDGLRRRRLHHQSSRRRRTRPRNPIRIAELRQIIFNSFLPSCPKVKQPRTWPRLWPWIYGDCVRVVRGQLYKQQPRLAFRAGGPARAWVARRFHQRLGSPKKPPATSLDQVPLAEQPAVLDRASLSLPRGRLPSRLRDDLADAAHHDVWQAVPHSAPHGKTAQPNVRRHPHQRPRPEWAARCMPKAPGDITRWMAVPWQTDTASCRSGYELDYESICPPSGRRGCPTRCSPRGTTRRPSTPGLPRAARIAAFNHRPSWLRPVIEPPASVGGRS